MIKQEHLNQNKSESMNRLLDLPLASSIKMINWFKDLKIMRSNTNKILENKTTTIIDTDSGINSMNSSCNNSPTTENPPLPSSQTQTQSIEIIQNEITKLTNQIAILPVDNHYESNSKF